MDHLDPLFILTGLLAVGVLSQWVAARLKIPAIVLLLLTGLALGPFSGVLRPDELLGELLPALVALSVAAVLFEGGLSLRIGEARKLGLPLFSLVFGGLVFTFALATWLAHTLAGLSWGTASVLGAILIVTGPTVIKPMLRQAGLQQRPALLLKWESIVNDAFGALSAVVALEVAVALGPTGEGSLSLLKVVPLLILTAGVAGALAGWGLGRAMDRGWIPEHLKVPTILAGVFVVFTASDALYHESGLLAVTVMGIVLANISSPSVESVRHFKENVATVLVALLFLVLSANLTMEELKAVTFRAGLFIVAVLVVVRPVAVWLSLGASRLPWRETALIGWIAPRGVVAAAMGAALEPKLTAAGFADANLLVPVLFGVIFTTVVLHGLTIRPLARRLEVAAKGDGGLLIVGSESWTIDLARCLARAGVDVVITDTDYRKAARARIQGIDAVFGDVLSEETLDELPVERLSWSLAATADDHYNSLVCVGLAPLFGRERTLQLTASQPEAGGEPHLRGRAPWGAHGRFAEIVGHFWRAGGFKATKLTPEYDAQAFQVEHPDARVLFQIIGGRLDPLEEEEKPKAGEVLVYLE